MKRLFLVPVLGLVTLATAFPAGAQSPGWAGSARPSYAEGQRQSSYDARRAAYDNGYSEGLKEGQKDGRKEGRKEGRKGGRRNETYRYQDERTYQRGDKGYHREYGNVEQYRQSFRTGYAAGYSDAYRRQGSVYDSRGGYDNRRAVPRRDTGGGVYYPNSRTYPGSSGQYPRGSRGYGEAAFQNGANDGYEKGIEDARKDRSFDPIRHSWYRSGDRHYDRRDGSREQYKDIYRRGFQEGYERGYRGARYR